MQSAWSRVVIAAAVALAVTASAYAAPRSTARAHVGAQVVDKTYSCRARGQNPFFFGTQVRLPATQYQKAQPAMATVITARDSAFQVVFKDVKNSLKVDTPVCRPSSRRVALKPAGLSLYQTVTPRLFGHLNGKCPTHVPRVLVHIRVSMTDGAPSRALFAVRKDDAKARPLAFFKWAPTKISGYLAGSCTVF
jgi:uncharacterized membrane protein